MRTKRSCPDTHGAGPAQVRRVPSTQININTLERQLALRNTTDRVLRLRSRSERTQIPPWKLSHALNSNTQKELQSVVRVRKKRLPSSKKEVASFDVCGRPNERRLSQSGRYNPERLCSSLPSGKKEVASFDTCGRQKERRLTRNGRCNLGRLSSSLKRSSATSPSSIDRTSQKGQGTTRSFSNDPPNSLNKQRNDDTRNAGTETPGNSLQRRNYNLNATRQFRKVGLKNRSNVSGIPYLELPVKLCLEMPSDSDSDRTPVASPSPRRTQRPQRRRSPTPSGMSSRYCLTPSAKKYNMSANRRVRGSCQSPSPKRKSGFFGRLFSRSKSSTSSDRNAAVIFGPKTHKVSPSRAYRTSASRRRKRRSSSRLSTTSSSSCDSTREQRRRKPSKKRRRQTRHRKRRSRGSVSEGSSSCSCHSARPARKQSSPICRDSSHDQRLSRPKRKSRAAKRRPRRQSSSSVSDSGSRSRSSCSCSQETGHQKRKKANRSASACPTATSTDTRVKKRPRRSSKTKLGDKSERVVKVYSTITDISDEAVAKIQRKRRPSDSESDHKLHRKHSRNDKRRNFVCRVM